MITTSLAELVRDALEAAASDGVLALDTMPEVTFERPKRREHGDWATNVALAAARGQGNPRSIAEAIVERLPANDIIESVEVAGPGFMNFHLAPSSLHEVVRRAADPSSGFGRHRVGNGQAINLEYVSSNPTGPINVVSGRHAAVGDALARLLEAAGYAVTREFYWNDMGRQMELFGRSIAVRYLEYFGGEGTLPEDGYRGDYIIDIARAIAEEVGDKYVDADPNERDGAMRELGMGRMLDAARSSLTRFGTPFDVWTLESSLHEAGEVEAGLQKLREGGWTYESEGAEFFRSTDLGDDKDRVLVRSTGQSTYFAADVAYLGDKFGRGFDRLIYLWGADHHGSVPRLLAAVDALGFERARVEVPIVQMVSLSRRGETVRASKRAGVIVRLDELIDEVGVDAARYTFLTRSMDAPLEFDIELAKEQAPENPVFYVQYAHARICSILRRATTEDAATSSGDAPLELLTHDSEDLLIRKLDSYEEVVLEAAERRAPQRVARYIQELASVFSSFYRDCQVLTDDKARSHARLALCVATKSVIADGLSMLGVTAPERM
ncbi:MAG: arginine--tRNA ligase [Actinobacteria bacterium]|nr:arginine--tRNA ligase [Actinomycetota bacterium]